MRAVISQAAQALILDTPFHKTEWTASSFRTDWVPSTEYQLSAQHSSDLRSAPLSINLNSDLSGSPGRYAACQYGVSDVLVRLLPVENRISKPECLRSASRSMNCMTEVVIEHICSFIILHLPSTIGRRQFLCTATSSRRFATTC